MTENRTIEGFERAINFLIYCIDARRNKPLVLNYYGADSAIKALEEWMQYRALGTVEELREATEKQKAKKPVDVKGNVNGLVHKCPNCGADYNRFYEGKPYCMFCEQAIDWSEEE